MNSKGLFKKTRLEILAQKQINLKENIQRSIRMGKFDWIKKETPPLKGGVVVARTIFLPHQVAGLG